LGEHKYTIGRPKTLQNLEKIQITGLKVQIRDSGSIWLINGLDRVSESQSAQTGSGSDAGPCRSAITDDQIGGLQKRTYK